MRLRYAYCCATILDAVNAFSLHGYGFKKKFYPEVRSEMGRILEIMNRQGDKSHSIVQYCLVMDTLTLSEIVLVH